MGADLSTPPTVSYHDDSPGANVWLTSSLTAVTPDYTQTYNPSSSLFPLAQQYLQGLDGNISGYGFLQPSLHHCCNATVGQDNFSGYATNYFYFYRLYEPVHPDTGLPERAVRANSRRLHTQWARQLRLSFRGRLPLQI